MGHLTLFIYSFIGVMKANAYIAILLSHIPNLKNSQRYINLIIDCSSIS